MPRYSVGEEVVISYLGRYTTGEITFHCGYDSYEILIGNDKHIRLETEIYPLMSFDSRELIMPGQCQSYSEGIAIPTTFGMVYWDKEKSRFILCIGAVIYVKKKVENKDLVKTAWHFGNSVHAYITRMNDKVESKS